MQVVEFFTFNNYFFENSFFTIGAHHTDVNQDLFMLAQMKSMYPAVVNAHLAFHPLAPTRW
jgi:hypothetical protein